MLLNEYQVNENLVNGELSTDGSETLIYIEKEIELRLAGSGTLVNIEKRIEAEGSGSLVNIEKRIVNAVSVNTFYTRNGWEPIITLGGLTVTANQIHGLIKIIKQEEDSHTAQFTLILSPAIYDLYNYQGKSVTINVRTASGVRRVFTGVVDVPVINAIEEKLTLNCISNRRALIANLSYLEPYIGFYSDVVLGDNTDTYERISARLSTIPSNLDFDSYNTAYITSWTPKGTADYSYGSSAVYRREPTLIIESSAKIINRVNLTLEYGYQRCHHREIIFSWSHPYKPSNAAGTAGICGFLQDRPTMPTRDMIRTAVAGAGWPVKNEIFFGRQFASGSYQCSGVWVFWSTVEASQLNAPILDSNGNPVLDAAGNPLSRSVQTILQDNTDLYTMSAEWIGTTRFNQNIKERYTIIVTAPNSVSRYGTLTETENYGYVSVFPFSEWERYTSYSDAPSGVTIIPNSSSSYFFNSSLDRNVFNTAVVCALNKAKTTILNSHRDTRIVFERDLSPELELYHTIELTGKWIRGKGKCKEIIHNMCVSDCEAGTAGEAYTQITLQQYRGVGTISESTLVPPSVISDTPNVQQSPINLDTHLGVDPNSEGSELWTGYVGNISKTKAIGQQIVYSRTDYQESFIVDTPDIESAVRDERLLTSSTTYNINIPTDDTEYEAYG